MDEPFLLSPNPYLGIKYTITFESNPGVLKPPVINFDSSEMRATLQGVSLGNKTTIGSFVYANGFHGEFIDYVPHYCEGIDVTLVKLRGVGNLNTYDYLGGLTPFEERLLKRCLGNAESAESEPNEYLSVLGEEFGWQFGAYQNPHLIKLVDNSDYQVHF